MHRLQTGRMRLLCGIVAATLCLSPVIADVTYTVKPGDTLSKIAQRCKVSLQELIDRNHLAHPDRLAVGQVLKVADDTPAKPSTEAAKAPAAKTDCNKTATQPSPSRAASNPRDLNQRRAEYLANRGVNVVANAKGMLGTPYAWAGTSSRGIDCSGLVVRSMALQGVNVPHNAAALYNMGVPVTYEQLQPGDLIFFNTNGKGVSHVGIWMGANAFIHASCNHGVVEQQLEGYYARTLVGARRIQ